MRHEENEIPSCDLSNFARPNPVVSPSPLTAFASSCSEKGPIVPEIQVWTLWAQKKITQFLSILLLPVLTKLNNIMLLCLSLPPCFAKKKHSQFVSPFFRCLPGAHIHEHTRSQKVCFSLSLRDGDKALAAGSANLRWLCFFAFTLEGKIHPGIQLGPRATCSNLLAALWQSIL